MYAVLWQSWDGRRHLAGPFHLRATAEKIARYIGHYIHRVARIRVVALKE